MKNMLVVLVVMVLVIVVVFGANISSPQTTMTGEFLVSNSLGIQIIIILIVLFTAYSLLKRHIIEY